MSHHHPPTELLLDFAAGGISEAVALAVACHAEMCEACRTEIRDYERIGGALFETLEPEPVDDAVLDRVMSRLDEPEPESRTSLELNGDTVRMIPAPLRRYLAGSLDQLRWRRVGKLFEEVRLPLSGNGFKATLMRVPPGTVMPLHTHRGQEYTLVLGLCRPGRTVPAGRLRRPGPEPQAPARRRRRWRVPVPGRARRAGQAHRHVGADRQSVPSHLERS